ncbi:hypothetical protein Cni_G17425 [Canna indica]|uniref:Uncharacterized protein n=1 Tax=Canna indica TaxID=4628 RepID=A0AAQ3KMG1_9LILI|nr:hypothetical protein Cni_G17425 [Canna indica]
MPPYLLALFRLLRFRYLSSAAAAATGRGAAKPHLMVEYLVSSCGFSVAEASKFSKPLEHLRSAEKPNAVVDFMRARGFSDANLRQMISWRPGFLCWNVETNLAPKFRSFRDLGLSESELVNVVMLNPRILNVSLHGSLFTKLEVWESLLGSRELLLKHLKKHTWFFSSSIDKRVRPNLKFLKDECGISEKRISLVVRKNPSFIVQKTDSLRALVVRADEMGLPRQSGMFMWILYIFCMVSKEKFKSHVKFLRSLGWSDSELSAAIKKQPSFLCLSPEALQGRMDYFVKDVGCTPSYIAQRPKLLMLSMEKRVIPRLRVIGMLESKGLLTGRLHLSYILTVTDAKFLERFVLPNKEKVPKLLDILSAVI